MATSTEVFGDNDDAAIYVRPYSKSGQVEVKTQELDGDAYLLVRFSNSQDLWVLIEALQDAALTAWPSEVEL